MDSPRSPSSEELLGSTDIQSLAESWQQLRSCPRHAAATAAPLVPVLLTIFLPVILRTIKVVFFEDSVSGRGQSANRKTALSYLFRE
jgi:hypothetical protein